jgi:ribose 1,5-bisphosphate isomerase
MIPAVKKIIEDIRDLKIQGARYIAKSALDAQILIAKKSKAKTMKELSKEMKDARESLEKVRATEPTLRNYLSLLFKEIESKNPDKIDNLRKLVIEISNEIIKKREDADEKIWLYGSRKVPDGGKVLVHCHSTTVVNILKKAWKDGKRFEVFSTETRPRYQGRKTAKELGEAKIPVTQIVDSAVGTVMKKIDLVLVGADAVTSEGAVVNKIGTKVIAMVAQYYGKPFYVCCSTFKIDPMTRLGFLEKIEERPPEELDFKEKGVKIFNPAFDVTNPKLIHGIITEEGVITASRIFDYAPTKA